MNIGIDFDGVLFDTETMFRAYSEIYNLQINGGEMIAPEELKLQKRYNWTQKQISKFFNKYLVEIQETAPVMPCAKIVLDILSKKHNLYAITSRGDINEKEIEITNKRLETEKIVFNDIIYKAGNKLDICKKYNIDLMIDDLYDNVEFLSNNGIKCLYYRDIVLKFLNNKNVKEVRNWGDILKEVTLMEKYHNLMQN